MGKVGDVSGCGLVSRQSTLGTARSVDWLFWHFACMLLFFSNQEAGFGICLIPGIWWEIQVSARKGYGVKILQVCRPRTLEPSAPRAPKMSRTHVGIGESGPEIKK